MNASQIEHIGNTAIRLLRATKFKKGQSFMINSRDLPSNMCYLEYPDGKMVLATVIKNARQFTILRNLSDTESDSVRKRYKLTDFKLTKDW